MTTVEELVKLPAEELKTKFEAVVKEVKEGPADAKTTNDEKLKIYGLFKQATVGDNTTAKPWAVQIEKKMKWDAWTAHKGKTKEQAMAEYVAEIEGRREKSS